MTYKIDKEPLASELLNEKFPKNFHLIYLSYTGSKLHGTDHENSDTDLKGIFVPDLESIITGDFPNVISIKTGSDIVKNSSEDIDIELFSIYMFLELLKKGDTNAIELLFSMNSQFKLFETEASKIIIDYKEDLIANKVLAFVGFANKQAAKYSVKGSRVEELEKVIEFLSVRTNGLTKKQRKTVKLLLFSDELYVLADELEFASIEEKEEGTYFQLLGRLHNLENTVDHTLGLLRNLRNTYGARAEAAKNAKGADFKAISHAIRTMTEAIELLTTGEIKFPLQNAKYLKDIKLGKVDFMEVMNQKEELFIEVTNLSEKSELQKSIDSKKVSNILKEVVFKTLNLKD